MRVNRLKLLYLVGYICFSFGYHLAGHTVCLQRLFRPAGSCKCSCAVTNGSDPIDTFILIEFAPPTEIAERNVGLCECLRIMVEFCHGS